MGLAANVVTRSGTNTFSGSATYSYSPRSWIGNNVPGGTASSASLVQPEASVVEAGVSVSAKTSRLMAFPGHRHHRWAVPLDRNVQIERPDPELTARPGWATFAAWHSIS